MGKLAPMRTRYTAVAMWLHWTIATFILFNLATGLLFDSMAKGVRGALIPLHISSGITVLALTVLRIAWRLTHRPPPMLPIAGWEKGVAHVVHFCLYLAMLGMPLTGWAMLSAHSAPPPVAGMPRPQTKIWGIIPLPKLAPIVRLGDGPDGPARLQEAHETFEARHGTGGWILLGLFLLHIAGALKHQFVDRRREFARMGVGVPEAA